MSTTLCIQVSSALQAQKMEFEFLSIEEWTVESESVLLHRLGEILALLRKNGLSLRFYLDVVVKDPVDAMFLIKKKLAHTHDLSIQNHKLSIREIEILGLIMLGYTNHQIAEKLFISFETVRSHRKHILEKTGAKNTAVLINYYHKTFFDK